MRILTFDLGTRCGWACTAPGGGIESGVQVFDVKRGESPGMRYLRFREFLTRMCDTVKPDLVVYEQTLARFAKGGSQTEIAAGFATRVQEICAERKINHTTVHPSTLKKATTGHGNAKKPDMIEAAVKRWPEMGEGGDPDDNEVDARWILVYAIKEFGSQHMKEEPHG